MKNSVTKVTDIEAVKSFSLELLMANIFLILDHVRHLNDSICRHKIWGKNCQVPLILRLNNSRELIHWIRNSFSTRWKDKQSFSTIFSHKLNFLQYSENKKFPKIISQKLIELSDWSKISFLFRCIWKRYARTNIFRKNHSIIKSTLITKK